MRKPFPGPYRNRLSHQTELYLRANKFSFQIQFHQVGKIFIKLFNGKIRQKLRLSALVNLADKIYQLSFAHIPDSIKIQRALCGTLNYRTVPDVFFNRLTLLEPKTYNIRPLYNIL